MTGPQSLPAQVTVNQDLHVINDNSTITSASGTSIVEDRRLNIDEKKRKYDAIYCSKR